MLPHAPCEVMFLTLVLSASSLIAIKRLVTSAISDWVSGMPSACQSVDNTVH